MAEFIAEQLDVTELRTPVGALDTVSCSILDSMQRATSDRPIRHMESATKHLTVLFADIKNFTRTFEYEPPEVVVEQLNTYFSEMCQLIAEHFGTLDAYTGDGLMAVFGLVNGHADDAAIQASRCAIRMQNTLNRLNILWEKQGKKQLRQGIGISTGPMMHTLLLHGAHASQTVLGNSVTLGARLEQYTRMVNAGIIICENTFARLTDQVQAITRDLGRVRLKGFSSRQHAYILDGFL